MSVFILKLIALISMIVDHIGYFFFENSPYYLELRMLGRIAAPVFLFLFVEGYFKTSNRKKYQKRLFYSSIIMFSGNLLLYFLLQNMYTLTTNIFFTMFLGTLLMDLLESEFYKTKRKTLFFVVIVLSFYIAEYSYLALFLILIFYGYHKLPTLILPIERKAILSSTYFIVSLFYCLFANNLIQLGMILAIPFFFIYNGKLGHRNKFTKYFFYCFYIVQLWFFVILGSFI